MLMWSHRVVRSGTDHTGGFWTIRRAKSEECSVNEVGRTSPHHDVVVLHRRVPHHAVYSLDLFLQFWLQEPAQVFGIRKIAERLAARDRNCALVAYLTPVRLE